MTFVDTVLLTFLGVMGFLFITGTVVTVWAVLSDIFAERRHAREQLCKTCEHWHGDYPHLPGYCWPYKRHWTAPSFSCRRWERRAPR